MRKNKTIQCPVCSSHKATDKFNFECGNFDGSALYWTIKLIICAQCGHIYNELTSKEIKQQRSIGRFCFVDMCDYSH